VSVRNIALRMLATLCVAGVCGAALQAQRSGARKPVTHTVTIDAATFSPAELEIQSGDTVAWINKDILAHTATSTSGGFDSKVIEPGKTWSLVVKKKGDFAYTCSFHPMNGRLKVR
jgi:plastocyanin